MNFDLDEDQRLLKASVERFATDRYGGDVERRRSYRATEHGFSPENWSMLADMGLTALPFSEADGGLGGGLSELMVAGEALGEGLVVEPWLESIVLAGGVFAHLAGAAQREELLPSIIAGECRLALAWAEAGSRYRHDAPGV
ncbi:MAG: acyl-CoA dehydrogenase family protein, partial [Pseudomonadota bacterium]